MSEFDDSFDDLLDDIDDEVKTKVDVSNILIIGDESIQKSIKRKIGAYPGVIISSQEKVEDAIQLLLQNVYAIVFIAHESENYDTVTASRVVRVNHPLARIIIYSNSKNSLLVSNLVNNGSVDGFIYNRNANKQFFQRIMTEHLAKHEIDKMIVKYISNPPKLSKASYLLLDPTLPFGRENDPVKYVGIMITHNSVPRFSHFFEELLAKDEILFSGYLSGIAMLGMQLFSTNEPIKEINFGGISVVMKFIGEFQFFIFVRNLSSSNVTKTEETIDHIVKDILLVGEQELTKHQSLRGKPLEEVNKILLKLEKKNELSVNILPDMIQYNEYIMLVGDDKNNLRKIKRYLERKFNFRVFITDNTEDCVEELKKNEYDILILNGNLKKNNALHLAEYAQDIAPHLQIIYRIRDMRTTDEVISALNSRQINYISRFKLPFRDLSKIIHSALKKAIEIKQQSKLGIQGTYNQAVIAKSMIRKDKMKYLAESSPELHGIIVSMEENFLYAYQPRRTNLIAYNRELLGGLVAALNSIGSEALGSDNIGSIEMVGVQVLITHRESYHIGFLVKNLDPNTSVVLTKDIASTTDALYEILKKHKKTESRNPLLAKEADKFNKFFLQKFEDS